MSSALQNRLVGTIIVVALAVIFLPDLLDGKKAANQNTFVSVPQAPDRKPLVQPKAFPAEDVAAAASRPLEVVDEAPIDEMPIEQSSAEQAPVESEQTAELAPSEVPDSSTLNTESSSAAMDLAAQTDISRDEQMSTENAGWVIQLGSFRNQKNVRELLDKLENAGYRAFSRPLETSVGRLNKVFVGPDLRREKLQEALPHLKEVTGLSGKITEFKV